MSKRLLIARIDTAHGVKGLVKLTYYGENINDLDVYNPLYIGETGQDILHIQAKNAIKNGFVAEIEGINDRNAAEKFRGVKLYVSEDKLTDVDEGEFFCKDLIGCDVYQENKKIGQVSGVDNFGAGDLLDIKPLSGQSFYLPFKDEFVGEIDLSKKIIHVVIPDGLLG